MYQTARMLDIALSRKEPPVCITRFAIRPAKSLWKNVRLWRTTCQWLCQRIRLVAPGTSTFWRITMSLRIASGRTKSTSAVIAASIGRHQRDEPADDQRDHGVEQRDTEAREEHPRVPALRLADEVPIERGERLRRLAG